MGLDIDSYNGWVLKHEDSDGGIDGEVQRAMALRYEGEGWHRSMKGLGIEA